MLVVYHMKNGKMQGTPQSSDNVPLGMLEQFFKLQEVIEKTEWNKIYRKTGREFHLLLPVYYYSTQGCGEERLSHLEFRDNMTSLFKITDGLKEPVFLLPSLQIKFYEHLN